MLANQVDDWHASPARVVQIRETVPESGAKMQQRARWFFHHARIAVRGSGNDAFEEAEHAAHFRRAVQRSDDVDF
jgi:hypothetical protein